MAMNRIKTHIDKQIIPEQAGFNFLYRLSGQYVTAHRGSIQKQRDNVRGIR